MHFNIQYKTTSSDASLTVTYYALVAEINNDELR